MTIDTTKSDVGKDYLIYIILNDGWCITRLHNPKPTKGIQPTLCTHCYLAYRCCATSDQRKMKAIKEFIQRYGKEELMEVLL